MPLQIGSVLFLDCAPCQLPGVSCSCQQKSATILGSISIAINQADGEFGRVLALSVPKWAKSSVSANFCTCCKRIKLSVGTSPHTALPSKWHKPADVFGCLGLCAIYSKSDVCPCSIKEMDCKKEVLFLDRREMSDPI